MGQISGLVFQGLTGFIVSGLKLDGLYAGLN